jgi:hypothetical protein
MLFGYPEVTNVAIAWETNDHSDLGISQSVILREIV